MMRVLGRVRAGVRRAGVVSRCDAVCRAHFVRWRQFGAAISATTTDPSFGTGALKFQLQHEALEQAQEKGPVALYEAALRGGELQEDAAQRKVMDMLNVIFHGAPTRQTKGLYLYGSVGCGKSMAMDLFYSSMQRRGLRVQRKHFHDFLNGVHVELHNMKKMQPPSNNGMSPVERYAFQLASKIDVLCFDEFAITTIQDCVLLMPLFSALFRYRVVVVATSNRAPEDLYTDGLNRHLYLPPFLDALREHCRVHRLASTTDYRAVHHENSPDAGVYCWPPDRGFTDRWFEDLVGAGGAMRGALEVSYGRQLRVPELSRCGRIARFSFDDICREKISADDYLYLCRQLHTIVLDDVPKLTVDDHNEARRFTLLIDCCYEHHVRLICSMAGSPQELLGGLSQLRDMTLASLGEHGHGCGDGDTSPSSSGVLQAISRIKESMASNAAAAAEGSPAHPSSTGRDTLDHLVATDVLSAKIERIQAHGEADVAPWRQGGASTESRDDDWDVARSRSPLQVSKAWDDRRRITQFTWESGDPTAEQKVIKGVFSAAVASLQESGFAVDRAISRLREMQTVAFQDLHKVKHLEVA